MTYKMWNIWKCDDIINLKIKKDLIPSNILAIYLKVT